MYMRNINIILSLCMSAKHSIQPKEIKILLLGLVNLINLDGGQSIQINMSNLILYTVMDNFEFTLSYRQTIH